MSPTQKIVQAWFDHIANGDAEAAFALFDENIVYDLKGSTPVSGVYTGLGEIVEKFFKPWRQQLASDLIIEVTELIGEGERVVALAKGSATTVFDLTYDPDYAFVFTVEGDKITRVEEFLDTALIETAAYGKQIV